MDGNSEEVLISEIRTHNLNQPREYYLGCFLFFRFPLFQIRISFLFFVRGLDHFELARPFFVRGNLNQSCRFHFPVVDQSYSGQSEAVLIPEDPLLSTEHDFHIVQQVRFQLVGKNSLGCGNVEPAFFQDLLQLDHHVEIILYLPDLILRKLLKSLGFRFEILILHLNPENEIREH